MFTASRRFFLPNPKKNFSPLSGEFNAKIFFKNRAANNTHPLTLLKLKFEFFQCKYTIVSTVDSDIIHYSSLFITRSGFADENS